MLEDIAQSHNNFMKLVMSYNKSFEASLRLARGASKRHIDPARMSRIRRDILHAQSAAEMLGSNTNFGVVDGTIGRQWCNIRGSR